MVHNDWHEASHVHLILMLKDENIKTSILYKKYCIISFLWVYTYVSIDDMIT